MIPAPPAELRVLFDVPLASRTTLRLGGPATALCEVPSPEAALLAAEWARRVGLPLAVLGGGSNTLVGDAGFAGLVLVPTACRLTVVDPPRPAAASDAPAAEAVRLRAEAGLSWDEVVAFAVRRGLGGIAALSGIPGRVGAAPVQNIGAYGEQLADVFVSADVVDLGTGRVEVWDAARARFGYRDSAWKRSAPGAFFISAVTLQLRRQTHGGARYPELRKALTAGGVDPDAAPLAVLRAAVLQVRRRKAMVLDPLEPDSRSVGSFFVNPIVDDAVADGLGQRVPPLLSGDPVEMPRWPAGPGRSKLSAAWLLELAGWRRGDGCDGPAIGAVASDHGPGAVGLSRRHVLALVHRGGGSATQLARFADDVAEGVRRQTGVTLEREPVWLGGGPDQERKAGG